MFCDETIYRLVRNTLEQDQEEDKDQFESAEIEHLFEPQTGEENDTERLD